MVKKTVRCTSCQFKGVFKVPNGIKVKYARCPGCGRISLK